MLGANARLPSSGRGVRGIVSALAVSFEGVLAAGTFRGGVGLVDPYSEAACAVYEILPIPAGEGKGVTSLRWHPHPSRCNYLVAASRLSTAMHVFDVRNPGAVLASLKGREAMTQQRLGVDVTDDGRVWAGGTDGVVKVWEGLGMREGDVEPALDMACHGDAVGGLGLHPGGAGVLATCAGSRRYGHIGASSAAAKERMGKGEESSDCSSTESDTLSSEDDGSTDSQSSSMSSASSSEFGSGGADNSLKVWML